MEYVIAVLLALLAGMAGFALWTARRLVLEVQDQVAALFDGGDQAPARQVLKAVAVEISEAVKTSISGALMGQASAISKQMDALGEDATADAAAQGSPLMGMLMQFPSIRKRLSKNPFAALAAGPLLQGLAGKLAGGGGSSPAPAGGKNHNGKSLAVP